MITDVMHRIDNIKMLVTVVYRLKALHVKTDDISNMAEVPSTEISIFFRCMKAEYSESNLIM